jgi:hypothetical protein
MARKNSEEKSSTPPVKRPPPLPIDQKGVMLYQGNTSTTAKDDDIPF